MTATDLLSRAAENLEETYGAIGRATPGARVRDYGAAIVCLCDLDHPVGNFALCRVTDGKLFSHLARLARTRSAFHAYVSPIPEQDHLEQTLHDAGFQCVYRLSQLAAAGSASESPIQLVEAVDSDSRRRIAQFMAGQFFARHGKCVREAVATATSESGLSLYEFSSDGAAVGAVMLCRTEGLLGIYSLCIEASRRGKGLGSEAVRALMDAAHREGREAVLQCDPSLVAWYERLGFRESGYVSVLSLENRKDAR